MLMAILLVYSASSITYVKKVCRYLKMAAILKKKRNITHSFNLTSDIKTPSQIMQKCIFMVMTSSMTSQGGLKFDLFIYV